MPDVTILIEADEVFDDFGHRGWHHYLYLDAEAREVSTWSAIGGGMPFAVFHRRALMIEIPDGVTGRHLAQWCEEHRAEIEALLSLYAGSAWDGHNHVGGWHEDLDGAELTLRDLLHDADLPKVWPAADWFGTEDLSWETVERAIGAREEVLDEIIAEAEADGALLGRDNLSEYLDDKISEAKMRDDDAVAAGAEAFRADLDDWGSDPSIDLDAIAAKPAACDWPVDAIREALDEADVPDATEAEVETFRTTYTEAFMTWQADRRADI